MFKLFLSLQTEAQSQITKSGDPGMELPRINLNPLTRYGYDRLDYGMTISIERTKKGRIWSCWVAGGDNADAFFVRFSYRHFPLTQIHQRAHKAAEAVIAAGQEGRYWEMHQLVMEHPHSLGIISLKSLAREAGVVNKRFLDQLMNGTFGWNVQDDLREGLSLGIREVPVLLINGSIIEKPLVAGHVNKAIRQLLTKSPRANGRVAA